MKYYNEYNEEITAKEYFEEYINFYTMNLKCGYKINFKAKENLINRTCGNYELLCELSGYDEIGLVEYVANNEFDIDYENKEIIINE